MNRRQFFQLLGSGVIGAAVTQGLDLDKLLWVPGEKTIFLPPVKAFGNQIVTLDWMTKEISRLMAQNLKFSQQVNRQYDTEYAGVVKIGDTVRVRTPQRFKLGSTLSAQRISPDYEGVTMTTQANVATSVHSYIPLELTYAQHEAEGIARALGDRLNDQGITIFGELPLPVGVDEASRVTDPRTGLSVRGVRVYDIMTDTMMTRFDVIGGKPKTFSI